MVVAWVPPWRDLDVPQSGACSLRGASLDRPWQGIRAIDAASRLGRRRQFGDIGRAVRPGQSESALRSQRHRQRRKYPAAPPQPSTAGNLLRLSRYAGATRTARDAALYRRVAADRQRPASLPAKTAASAPGATGGEQFHGDLPGVLAVKLRSIPQPATTQERTCRCSAFAGNNLLLPDLWPEWSCVLALHLPSIE
jgi:hypothetical protein